jgi:hypothetical protein
VCRTGTFFMGVLCEADNGDDYEAAYPKTPNGAIEFKNTQRLSRLFQNTIATAMVF